MVHIFKHLAAAAAIAVMFPCAAQAEQLPSRIMNSSFERPYFYEVFSSYSGAAQTPKVVTNTQSGDDITMRSTSAWMVTSKKTFDQISDDSFYWNTTAYNRRIELVSAASAEGTATSGVGSYLTGNTSAAHGSQLAELVAEEESSLYQNISTQPRSTLTWSLSHRARANRQNKDTMAVFIGPMQQGLTKSSAAANDIFKQMAMLLYTDFDSMDTGMSERAVKLYSSPVYDGMTVTEANVSRVKTEQCSQEWFCWIITSDKEDWHDYSDTYRVPDGQKETTLAFTALTSGVSGSSQTSNTGNLIDNVQLGIMHQLNVSSMGGGSGSVIYSNDGVIHNDGFVFGDTPYIKNFEEGTRVRVDAVPDEGFTFVGAVTDAGFISNGDFDYDPESNTYSYSTAMDTSRYVLLLFAKAGYVIYDPNNGSFEGTGSPTLNGNGHSEYSITEDLPLSQSAVPVNGEKRFVGWRVYADGIAEGSGDYFIPADHTVNYNNDGVFTISYNDGEDKIITISTSNDTVLFRAEYENRISVHACYVGVDGKSRHNDSSGGTAYIRINGSGQDSSYINVYSGASYTVTAYAKPGYEFKGWYYTYDNDDSGAVYIIPDTDTEYSGVFSAGEDITMHARFVEKAIDPMLYVTGEDEAATGVLSEAGLNSASGSGYGGSLYGSTIATAFNIIRNFSGTEVMPGGVWTIYLPTNGMFIKIPDGEHESQLYEYVDTSKAVYTDSENVEHNRGTIYGMQEAAIGKTEMFHMYAGSNSGVVLTDATVKFGLVIDNLYAPNAVAGFKTESEKPNDVPELSGDNSIHTDFSGGGYEHNETILNGSK